MTTLLQFSQRLAKNVGHDVPTSIYSNSDREAVETLEFAHEAGRELLRRFDWSELFKETTVNGSGSNDLFALPSDFARLAHGASVRVGTTALRPLTQREWGTLTVTEGTPRYFLLEGSSLRFWPYPAQDQGVTVGYMSKNWTSAGASFTADDNTVVFPEDVFGLGMIVRWRRQKGMDYADFEAEYEAMLADQAKFDRHVRF